MPKHGSPNTPLLTCTAQDVLPTHAPDTIDVVFVAKNGEVMKVAPNVGAWRMRSCRRAFAVLELAAGEAERRGITVGDRIDKAGAT